MVRLPAGTTSSSSAQEPGQDRGQLALQGHPPLPHVGGILPPVLLSTFLRGDGSRDEVLLSFYQRHMRPSASVGQSSVSIGESSPGGGVYAGVLLNTAEYHSPQSLFPAPAPHPACGPVQSPFSLTPLGLWEVESSPAREGRERLGSTSRKEGEGNARMENSTQRTTRLVVEIDSHPRPPRAGVQLSSSKVIGSIEFNDRLIKMMSSKKTRKENRHRRGLKRKQKS